MAMNALPRAVCGTIRAIPQAVTAAAWTDSDLAVIALELERARKALYLELDKRHHRKWTAAARRRGAS
jgi:hypothetical protein